MHPSDLKNEDQLQAWLWTYTWNTYPQSRRCMWAVPNGLKLNPIQATLAKATGLLAGCWDLHAFYKGQFHIIETKWGSNGLTEDRLVNGKKVYGQKEWGELMASHGAHRHIYRTAEDGMEVVQLIFC